MLAFGDMGVRRIDVGVRIMTSQSVDKCQGWGYDFWVRVNKGINGHEHVEINSPFLFCKGVDTGGEIRIEKMEKKE